MPRPFATAAFALVSAAGVFAQSPAARPAFDAFEVATVKRAAPDSLGRFMRMQSANRFIAKNYTLKVLAAAAYNLPPRAILGGPAWVDSESYDILAGTPGDVRPTVDEQLSMLRSFLADRFKLAFHREEKDFAIYSLTVAKSGSKLRPGTPDTSPEGPPPLVFVLSPQGVSMSGRSATVGELAAVMQRSAVDRPVVDKTQLSGRYDFELEFTPDESQFGGAAARLAANADPARPDLFTALQQQLGLRMDATRGPIEALVIDRAERPDDN